MTAPIVQYALSLVCYAEGWKLNVLAPDAGSPPVPLTIKRAEAIAKAMGDSLPTDQSPSPFEIVRKGSASLRAALQQRLREAETAAASVDGLRQVLGEIEGE